MRRLMVFAAALGLVASLTPMHTARAGTAPPAWLADVDGRVITVGSAPYGGGLGGVALKAPVIAIAKRPHGSGYWMAALDGGVFSFGGAPFFGSLGGRRLNQPVVGMSATPTGRGYWLVAADGGVFTFGDAPYRGSLGGRRLNQPIVTMAPTPSGRGYWLVAADGGVFTFGDAAYRGSLGGTHIAAPIATVGVKAGGHGYWLMDRAGRVSSFGDARGWGSANVGGALAVGIVSTPTGNGYWITSSDGVVRAFGDAAAVGSLASPKAAVVGMATPWASSSGYGLPMIEFLRAHPTPPRTWVRAHEAALTFDDGPSIYTPYVLATLAKYGVRATFFPVGYEVAAHPQLIRDEIRAGMAVGDHSWDHADLTRLSKAAVTDELRRGANAVAQAGGRRPVCFRPPYGATNATVVEVGGRLGMNQVLWNVDPSDYLRPGASTIVSRVMSVATGRGLVIAIHDGGGDRSQTVAALPGIIFGLRALGYTFVRLC